MNIEKIENRILEIDKILNNKNWSKIDSHSLIIERSEKEFLINKQGIYFRLTGDTKYYWANQFKYFRKNVEKYGNKYAYEIKGENISFHKYYINKEQSLHSRHLWTFDSTDELKGFVKGYNEICTILENENKTS